MTGHQAPARLPRDFSACNAPPRTIGKDCQSWPPSGTDVAYVAASEEPQTSTPAHSRGGRLSGPTFIGSPGLSHFLARRCGPQSGCRECPLWRSMNRGLTWPFAERHGGRSLQFHLAVKAEIKSPRTRPTVAAGSKSLGTAASRRSSPRHTAHRDRD